MSLHNIPNDWKIVPLGDVSDITKLAGFEFTKHFKYTEDGEVIALRALNVKSGNLVLGDIKRISRDISNSLERSKLYRNDILFTYTGTIGGFAIIEEDDRFHLAPNVCRVRPNSDQNAKYFFSYFRSKQFHDTVKNYIVGSTQPTIPMKNIRKIEIVLPPTLVQDKIAHIVLTLDNKIELNRKMNQTLEEMAQALFKSWFVDFDPVHAKADAKSDAEMGAVAAELGISKEVLELFPSEFVESEMGMIPKGWKQDTLGSFVDILDSKRIPLAKNERAKRQGDIPYYGATSIMDYVDDFIFDEPLTLLGEDGSVVRADGTPFMQYIWGKAWVNNHAHVLRSKSALSTEAVYIALLKQNVTRFVTGAVQPKINQGNLKTVPIVNTGEKLHKVYSELIAPMFSQLRLLKEEIDTLVKTRDTLLPKLLSGELDVSSLEVN